jgi:hypothetical protein
MWASLFAIGVAAAVCLSAVNLASEMDRIHEARHSVVVEHSMPPGAPPLGRATDAGASTNRKPASDPGA